MAGDDDARQRLIPTDAEDAAQEQDIEHNPAATEQTPLLPRRDGEDGLDQPATRKFKWRWPSLVALVLLILGGILIIILAFVAPNIVKEYAEQAIVVEPRSLSIDSFTESGVRTRIQASVRLDSSRVAQDPVRNLGRFFTYIASEVETGESDVEVSLPEYGNVVLGTAQVPPIKMSIRDGQWKYIDILVDVKPGQIDSLRSIANDWIDGRLGRLRVLAKAQVPLKSGLISIGRQDIRQELTLSDGKIPNIPAYDLEDIIVHEVDGPKGKGSAVAIDASLSVVNEYPVEFTVPPLNFDILVDACAENDPNIVVARARTHELAIKPEQSLNAEVTATMHHLPGSLIRDCPNAGDSPLDRLVGNYLHGKNTTIYIRGSHSASPTDPTSPDQPSTAASEAPEWLTGLLASLTLPIPIPPPSLDKNPLIRNFSLTNTHFDLPDPWAEDPNSPEARPRISADVRALVALPPPISLNLKHFDVDRVRADADVLYQGTKFAELDLSNWQSANLTHVVEGDWDRLVGSQRENLHTLKLDQAASNEESTFSVDLAPARTAAADLHNNKSSEPTLLLIQSHIDQAPLVITDEDIFTTVVEKLIFGGKGAVVHLQIVAKVDVEVVTSLGDVVVRGLPAHGDVPLKPLPPILPRPNPPPPSSLATKPPSHEIPETNLTLLHPRLTDLRLDSSTPHSISLAALTAFTNPTPYSANVPYISIDFLSRGHRLGAVVVKNTSIQTGENEDIGVLGVYDPLRQEDSKREDKVGEKARNEGRALLGKFISGGGDDLIIGVRGSRRAFAPEGSPAARNESSMAMALGRVLENFGTFEVKIPKGLFKIGAADDDDDDNDDEDDGLHFIQDATFHLFSSTATFVLLNPLPHDSITITRLNATALYPREVDDGDGDGDDDGGDGGDGGKKKKPHNPPHNPDDDDPWLIPAPSPTTNPGDEPPKPPKTTLHPIAHILYDSPLTIPPRPPNTPSDGDDDDEDRPGWETPRLPVEWSLGSVGYEAVRKALGGSLKVGARAEIDVALGRFREEGVVFERGGGIGARVRL